MIRRLALVAFSLVQAFATAAVAAASTQATAQNVLLGDYASRLYGGSDGDTFANAIAAAGDVNGDGIGDVLTAGEMATNTYLNEGKVELRFGRLNNVPLHGAAWTAYGLEEEALFGHSLAGIGDVNGDGYDDVAIGAPGADAPGFVSAGAQMPGLTQSGVSRTTLVLDAGRVDIYLGSPTGLSQTPARVLYGRRENQYIGSSLDSAGDVNGDGFDDLLVGGRGGLGYAGLFLGSSDGLRARPAWTSIGSAVGRGFGTSVAGLGDVNSDGFDDIAVGAPHDKGDVGQGFTGRVFLFLGGPGGPATNPDWSIGGEEDGDRFGVSIAGVGDTDGDGFDDLLVGAPNYDGFASNSNHGRAYLFRGCPDGLLEAYSWVERGEDVQGHFGKAVSGGDLDGDGYSDLVIGAPYHDTDFDAFDSGINNQLLDDAGRVFVHRGSPDGPQNQAYWVGAGQQEGELYGLAVATLGDINGDGTADMGIGAPQAGPARGVFGIWESGLPETGAVSADPDWHLTNNGPANYLGRVVSAAGDVNGDGHADVLVGGARIRDGSGRAVVFWGSASGPDGTFWQADSPQANAEFGNAGAGVGDVNNDGYDDIVIGAARYDVTSNDEGRAFLYLGSANGPVYQTWVGKVVGENALRAEYGASIAGAGDINGDGFDDVIIGAPRVPGATGFLEGRAYVYAGGNNGLSALPVWTGYGTPNSYDTYGISVAGAGDVNGDGFDDVLVQAGNADSYDGAAYLYLGSAVGLPSTPDWTITGAPQFYVLGDGIAGLGDVDGDGYDDIGVSQSTFVTRVFLGSATGPSLVADYVVEGGKTVGRADVNGDGYADVLTTNDYYSNGEEHEAQAFVYLGGPAASGGLDTVAAWKDESDQHYAFSLTGFDGVGDLNGDGKDEIGFGLPFFDLASHQEGVVFVYRGR